VNWSEEKYVKIFVRDTPTWLAWPWQARALAPLLMRKLESDGRLAVGRLEPARAVALTVGLPIEVVAEGLPAMLEDGTLELRDDGLWWPKFEEAQESRKSEALRSREHRAKQRRESSTPTRHAASHAVTPRHTPSPSSPAQPSTAQPSPEKPAPRAKAKKEPKPPDPRHQPMVAQLTAIFERETGAKYPFASIDAAAVTALLAKGIDPTITAAWTRALRHTGFPTVRTLPELVKNFAHFVGRETATGPPSGAATAKATDWSDYREGDTARELFGETQ
jgi:hypothetical protein